MAQDCPHCGAALPVVSDAFCPECRNELPPLMQGDEPNTDAPAKSSQPRPPPRIPASVVVLFPALLCAAFGVVSSTTAPVPSAIVGGCIGLLLGLAVFLDDRAVRRQFEEAGQSVAAESAAETSPNSAQDRTADAIAVTMLVIPVCAGIVIWQRELLQVTTTAVGLLAAATVLSTAVLGYYDLRRLVVRSRGVLPIASPPASPVAAFLGILGLWLVAYPVHFIVRRRFGATNLIVPGLVVTAVFVSPSISAWFSERALPAVESPEVLALVSKIIEDVPINQARKDELGVLQIREPIELSFDQERQRRVARATLVSKLGEEVIFYTVEWNDRKKGIFRVQVSDKRP